MKNLGRFLIVVSFVLGFAPLARAGKLPQSFGINPVGLALNGLSYAEFEILVGKRVSLAGRVDMVKYKVESSDGDESYYTDYAYTEEGSGFGGGVSSRVYLQSGKLVGLFGGAGVEFVTIDWKWLETYSVYGYDYEYKGDGSTSAVGYHVQGGYKIPLGEKAFLEPSIYAGSFSFSEESIEGFGVFIQPSVVLGLRF